MSVSYLETFLEGVKLWGNFSWGKRIPSGDKNTFLWHFFGIEGVRRNLEGLEGGWEIVSNWSPEQILQDL